MDGLVLAPVAPPPPAPGARNLAFLSTGVPRLDVLLGGGYPTASATLLYGPPFTGKQVLQQVAVAAAVARGVPAVMLLHGLSADAMSQRLRAIDPRVAQAEAAGLVSYIDVHSQVLGEPSTHPCTVPVADPHSTNAVASALAARLQDRPALFAVQSASTLLMDLGAARAFQFLRGILGRIQRTGGVGLVTLQAGMHPDAEVQMAKHLCAGMLELRRKGNTDCLHIEGLETTVARPGWIDFEASHRGFRLTGSFAARTIH